MIYNQINAFCKVRNKGNCFSNGSEPTPRVKFLMELLDSEGIKYELDVFEREVESFKRDSDHNYDKYREFMMGRERERGQRPRRPIFDEDYFKNLRNKRKSQNNDDVDNSKNELHFFRDFIKGGGFFDDENDDIDKSQPIDRTPIVNKYFNIIMKGTSNKMVVAHHDVNNPTIDNANDNSASVINVIATKKLRPSINAVLLDGEEFGGIGSNHLSKQIKEGKFGSIEWVLNYELTGKGGKYFFIGNYPGKLSDHIIKLFNCPIVNTPFNDSVIFKKNGIDSTVINPVPPLPDGKKSDVIFADGTYLDTSILHNCHSPKDMLSSISVSEMKEFVESVALKIIDN